MMVCIYCINSIPVSYHSVVFNTREKRAETMRRRPRNTAIKRQDEEPRQNRRGNGTSFTSKSTSNRLDLLSSNASNPHDTSMTIVYALISVGKTVLAEYTSTSGKHIMVIGARVPRDGDSCLMATHINSFCLFYVSNRKLSYGNASPFGKNSISRW